VDESKIVSRLCAHDEVPVEVVPFGWQSTARRVDRLGWKPVLRADAERKPYITDGGHCIEDCFCDEDISIQRWAAALHKHGASHRSEGAWAWPHKYMVTGAEKPIQKFN
jgi:ribose 5-phosphate isomerase